MKSWAPLVVSTVVLSAAVPVFGGSLEGLVNRQESAALTVLHTNDLHGHLIPWRGWEGELAGRTVGGAAVLATAIKQVRASVGAEHVLLLDAGDTLGDTMLADETQGSAVIQFMNAVGYDAMVIGNHEPDFTMATLQEQLQEARFTVLAANVTDGRSGHPIVQPALIREVAGVRIGILGLAYPHTALTTLPQNVAGVRFLPPGETARQWIPRLRGQGVQVLIVLSHLGLEADMELARTVDGIDVIVGGHSHNRVSQPIQVGSTLIVQAGAHGSDLGRLDLELRGGLLHGQRGELLNLDHDRYAPDSEIGFLVARLREPYRTRLEEPVAITETGLARAQTLADSASGNRDAESPADELFADLLREALQVDLVLLPGVGYGVAIEPGTVTAEELRNLLPHESDVVTMKLTGRQVCDIIEQSIDNVLTEDANEKVGGMIQVSGLAFAYDPKRPPFHRLRWITVRGERLDPARFYEVATDSLLSEGGHRYRTFLDGADRTTRGREYDLIRRQLASTRRIEAPAADRIHVAP